MSEVRDVKGDPGGVWYDLDWEEMNAAEQKLWGALGWKESSWDDGKHEPDSDDKDWADLSDAEKEAATGLGFTEKLWDVDD